MMDYLVSAFKNIFRNKFRSTLTMLGIAIGVCSVVIIGSIGDIGTALLNDEISSFGIGGLTIGVESNSGSNYLYADDLEAVQTSAYVKEAIPILMEYTQSQCRNLVLDTALWGIGSGSNQIFALELLHGRLFTQADIAGNELICLVDEEYALKTYMRSNIVGKTVRVEINGQGQDLEIVGVVQSGGAIMQSLLTTYIPAFVYTPYTTIQSVGGKSHFDQICVEIDDTMDGEVVANALIRLLEEKNAVENAYKSENVNYQKEQLYSILSIVTVILSVIAGISLVVAGLSIMTVMMVSVSERTREIGIKKSIGANKLDILIEFLLEAFIITMLGSATGLLLGLLFSFTGCQILSLDLLINWPLTAFCITFSLCTGVIFGIYPALKASSLKPIDALRFE